MVTLAVYWWGGYMKKVVDIARFILFICAGLAVYVYMGNVVAAQALPSRLIIEMTNKESYDIWKAVEALEKPWYKKDSSASQDVSLDVVSLDPAKSNNLIRLVAPYGDLKPLAEQLLLARERGNWEDFIQQKEKIAEELEPIWQRGAREIMREEGEHRGIKAWFSWFKNNIYQSVDALYAYFFSAQQK